MHASYEPIYHVKCNFAAVYSITLWCTTVHCGVYNCALWCTTVHCGYLCSKTRHFILQFSHPVIHYSLLIIINKIQTDVSKFNRKSVLFLLKYDVSFLQNPILQQIINIQQKNWHIRLLGSIGYCIDKIDMKECIKQLKE